MLYKNTFILLWSLAVSSCSDEEALNITTFQHDCRNVILICTINPSCCTNAGVQFIINNTLYHTQDITQHYLIVDYLHYAANVYCRCRRPDRSYHAASNVLFIPTPCPLSTLQCWYLKKIQVSSGWCLKSFQGQKRGYFLVSACSDEEALNITTFQHDCRNVILICTINPSCCTNAGVQFIINNTLKNIADPTQYLIVDYLQDAANVSCRCRRPDTSYRYASTVLFIPTPCPLSTSTILVPQENTTPACSDGEALSITTTFQHDCQHVTFKCTINSSCCSNLAQFVINNTTRYPDWSNGTQYYLTTHNQEDTSNVSCRCRSDGGYITSNGLFIPTPCPSSTYIFFKLYPKTSETTEKTFSEGANESSSALLIVTIVVITAIVIAVIVTAIVIVLSIKYQRGKVSSGSDPIYEMPSDINTYVLEMKKSEAYGVVTSAQEPYAMSACSAYEL